jgi:hypothetical protein
LDVLRRQGNAHNAGWQRRSILCAVKRAQHFLFLRKLGLALLEQHCPAALHVHHATHGAIAFTELQGYTGERAEEHEPQKRGCDPHLHL